MVIDHISEERGADADRHVKFRQLLLAVLFSGQMSQIQSLKHLFAKDGA